MNKTWTSVTAGLLAGAAGATAQNAISYLDQAVTGSAPPSSPTSATVTNAASTVSAVAVEQVDRTRSAALGPLGGVAVGLGVGAVAGRIRGGNATPNPVLAAVVTGLAAMGVGDGLAALAGQAPSFNAVALGRDVISHLAYGAVTGYALHRLLDPRSPSVARHSTFG